MAQIYEIKAIQWCCLTGEQLEAYSVAAIDEPCSRDQTGLEKRNNTPSDSRLGEQTNRVLCSTCGKYNTDCPGHMGHIKLPFIIYNKQYVNYVLKILQCVCSFCSRLRIPAEHIKIQGFLRLKGDHRLKSLSNKCNKSVKVCPWDDCGEPLIFYSLATKKNGEKKRDTVVINYNVSHKKETKHEEFSATEAYNVLSRISFEDLQILGFNEDLLTNSEYINPQYFINEDYVHVHQFKPEALFYTHFPVITPLARTYVQDDDGTKDDDLTAGYNNLIENVNLYKIFTNENQTKKSTVSTRRGHVKSRADVEKDIMESVWKLCDNREEKNKMQNGNKVYRSIRCRIVGKEGRIQQNVAGKRTNFSARSVIIGGGYDLRMDELGVPREIAETTTKGPFFVGEWNIEEMQDLLKQGKITYVDRKERKNGVILSVVKRLHRLPDKGIHFILKIGDVIRRHLIDGDIVLINRQPTLNVENKVAFRAKIIEGEAIQLGLCWTTGFNADYDGSRSILYV
jgi:DNA-directed RNA polymerase II subunit RPB1